MDSSYIDLLREELADAYKRYAAADKAGRGEVAHQIKQIKRDIRRNSKNT